ncbi:DUF4870 family protein [Psychrobacter ciconiae]|uniref:DUF4870 family protein n=1 Tax=Psychrobacter ciconiae TaxID=1553449 RepID=UPI0019188315|nr:hypothetical protein [Psychrobacter ciconiae]
MDNDKERSLIAYNHITYLLNIVSYFTAGLLWIAPIVMNYVRRHEADGTWLATHFDWQIKTFWYSIFFFVIGMILLFISFGGLGISAVMDSGHLAAGSLLFAFLGVAVIGVTVVWHLYRIIRGWIALASNRPVP